MKEKTAKRIMRKMSKKIILGLPLNKNEEKSVRLATATLVKEKRDE